MYAIQKPSENAAHNAADIYVRQFAKKKNGLQKIQQLNVKNNNQVC